MPSSSKAQAAAMFSAAKGKSKLGIPKGVGQDFAAADQAAGPAAMGKLPDKSKQQKTKKGATPNNPSAKDRARYAFKM